MADFKFPEPAAAAGGMVYLDLSALTPSGAGSAIIDSVTAQGDGWYRIALVDMSAASLQRDNFVAECAHLFLETEADLATLFGYQWTVESRNCTTKPDIYVGGCIVNNAQTEGVALQHDEYPTGGHYTVMRSFDFSFALGASAVGGTGAVMMARASMHHLPTAGDMQYAWHSKLAAGTVELSNGDNKEAEAINSGLAKVGVVIGCKEADLGAGEYVDVRMGYKSVTWS